MRPRITIRGSVGPSNGPFIGPSVGSLVGRSPVFFRSRKLTNLTYLTNLTPANLINRQNLTNLTNLTNFSLQFYLTPLLQTHLCSNELVFYQSLICIVKLMYIAVCTKFDSYSMKIKYS